ncbi:MAG TPA: hydrogenase 4 subunit F [Symbiobacteriaceae bacterium]|nr:hydrogenase 4 subunit F [Symbiobacteriaceae bacterium]
MSTEAPVLEVPIPAVPPGQAVTWAGGVWSGLVLVLSLLAARAVFTAGPVRSLFGIVYVDSLGALMLVLIALVGLMATLYAGSYLRHEQKRGQVTALQHLHFFGWFHLFQITMIAAVVVENIGFIWVAVEATTLVSAVLVGFYNRRESLEAAWKYVILCSVGIAFAMLGVILLYTSGVHAGLDHREALNWTSLMAIAPNLNPAVVRMAFALALVGFGTKAGLAPMHTWLPDAHSQAPSPVSALLSGVLLNIALYAALRVELITRQASGAGFTGNLLLTFGLVSLGIAALFILVQRDLKRLLAYSSVEHMGLVCVAIGLGGPVGLSAAVLHMVCHSLVKPVLFFAAGNLGHRYHSYHMERIRGACRAMPLTGGLLIAGALAITGMPPTSLFLSEFGIVAAGFAAGRAWASVVVLLALAVAFAGLLLHVKEMALGEAPHGIQIGEGLDWRALPLLVPLALAVLLGIWMPPAVADALRQVAAMLGGGL